MWPIKDYEELALPPPGEPINPFKDPVVSTYYCPDHLISTAPLAIELPLTHNENSIYQEYLVFQEMGAGAAWIILNIFRLLTITSLILSGVVSVLLITLQAPHFAYNFFGIIGNITRIVTSLGLLMTEVPIPLTTRYLESYCRVFTLHHSLAWTGVPLLSLSASILSNLHNPLLQGTIGEVTRGLLEATGCSVGIMGAVYCLMPIVYWKYTPGACRRARKYGASRPIDDDVEKSAGMNISRPMMDTAIGGTSTQF